MQPAAAQTIAGLVLIAASCSSCSGTCCGHAGYTIQVLKSGRLLRQAAATGHQSQLGFFADKSRLRLLLMGFVQMQYQAAAQAQPHSRSGAAVAAAVAVR